MTLIWLGTVICLDLHKLLHLNKHSCFTSALFEFALSHLGTSRIRFTYLGTFRIRFTYFGTFRIRFTYFGTFRIRFTYFGTFRIRLTYFGTFRIRLSYFGTSRIRFTYLGTFRIRLTPARYRNCTNEQVVQIMCCDCGDKLGCVWGQC